MADNKSKLWNKKEDKKEDKYADLEEEYRPGSKASFKQRIAVVKKTRWIRFAVVSAIFFFWVAWMTNPWLLLAYPLLFDIYITLYIPWNWWKYSQNKTVRTIMSWCDSIVYALILVYFIFAFVGQNYKIPSSSLEKTLLIGDYLWVNKMCYGPRVPQTVVHFPLCQNTLPIINTKSYLDKPQVEYHRLKGFRSIERNDIVVFNFPTGDTIAFNAQNPDYYSLSYLIGKKILSQSYQLTDEDSYQGRMQCIAAGGNYIKNNPQEFGEVLYRPVDRRENYVKRCIGLPGDYLKIVDNIIYINGKPLAEPQNVQYNYYVHTSRELSNEFWEECGVSMVDRGTPLADSNGNFIYALPLTYQTVEKLKANKFVTDLYKIPCYEEIPVYPVYKDYGWTRANYATNLPKGILIPKKGQTLAINAFNIPIYERIIKNYEGNDLRVDGDKIYINGKEVKTYTFKMDYYWMMGDNRDNSADSRNWGFVPEDHIVGTPMFVIMSIDEEKGLFSGFRTERLFKDANPDK